MVLTPTVFLTVSLLTAGCFVGQGTVFSHIVGVFWVLRQWKEFGKQERAHSALNKQNRERRQSYRKHAAWTKPTSAVIFFFKLPCGQLSPTNPQHNVLSRKQQCGKVFLLFKAIKCIIAGNKNVL